MTDNQTPLGTYTYDANGNMTCRIENGVTFKQVYNTENRISSIMKLASGTCTDPNSTLSTKWDYAYDGDGVRTSTLTTPFDSSGNPLTASLTAYYFGGAYETRSNGSIFKYYAFGGQSIVNEYKPATSTWTLSYMLTDHLGSVVAITNASGALVSQQRYLPFGGIRTNVTTPNSPSTDFGYTGQRNLDSAIGLMDYKARFYSPVLNRFIQPDTIVPDPMNPQAWNRFSYVGNNPINFSDPTGHVRCNEEGECWDGKTKLISNIHTEDFLRDTSEEDDDTGGGDENCVPTAGQWLCDLDALDDPSSHSYTITNMVCPAELQCTEKEMKFYLSMYAYPGQVERAENLHPYWVSPFSFFPGWAFFYNMGSITVEVTNGGLTSTNISQPSHIFHDGIVVRELSQDMDGNWFVTTTGTGANDTPFGIGLFIDVFNDVVGPPAFHIVDMQMASTIAEHHGMLP